MSIRMRNPDGYFRFFLSYSLIIQEIRALTCDQFPLKLRAPIRHQPEMSVLGNRWMFSMFYGCARHFRYSLLIFASLLLLDHLNWGVLAQQSDFSRVFEPPRLEEILGGPNQWRLQQSRRPFGQMFYYPAGDYWRYFGSPFGYQADYYWNPQTQSKLR